jgi:hypothetical protein
MFATFTVTDETYRGFVNMLEIVSYCPLCEQVYPETLRLSVSVETCTSLQIMFERLYWRGNVMTTVLPVGTVTELYTVGLRSGFVARSAVNV